MTVPVIAMSLLRFCGVWAGGNFPSPAPPDKSTKKRCLFKWLVGAGELLHIGALLCGREWLSPVCPGELLCGRDWLSPVCPSISESLTPDGVKHHGRKPPALLVLPGWRHNGREFVPALASYCKVSF